MLIYVNDRYALKTIDGAKWVRGGEFTGILLWPILGGSSRPILVNFFFSEIRHNTEAKTTEKPFVAILLNLTGFCAFPYRTIMLLETLVNRL